MDTTSLLWIISLFISIISVGIFLYLSYRHRQKLDRLQRQIQEQSPRLADAFIQRELQHMRLRSRTATNANTEPSPFVQWRSKWLEAELIGLVEHGRLHSNADAIQRAALPLLRLLAQPAASPPAWENKKAIDNLHKARNTIAAQTDAIASFRQHHGDASTFSSALDNVDKNNHTLLETISRLEAELASLQTRFERVNIQLTDSRHQQSIQKPIDIQITSAANPQAAKQSAMREVLGEIEQAYQQSLKEMNRMRTLNTEQRGMILQLEKELLQLRGNAEQYATSTALLDKMKLQLRDYETCTVILEMETETLRERIETLNVSLQKEEEESVAEAIAPAADAMVGPELRIHELSLAFLRDIAGLSGMEQIASRMVVYLREAKLVATFFFKLDAEEAWAASEGVVDAHDRRLLQSVAPELGKPRVDIEEGVLLLYPWCGVLVHARNRTLTTFDNSCASLQMVLTVFNHWLNMLSQRPVSHAPATASLHNRMTSLLTQHTYVIAEHARINHQLRQELDTIFGAVALTPVQRQMANTMLEDFDAQTDIIGKAGKLIHAELKATLADLDGDMLK